MTEGFNPTETPLEQKSRANFELIKRTFLDKNITPTLIVVAHPDGPKETIIYPTIEGMKDVLDIYPNTKIQITFKTNSGETVFTINP